MRNFVDTDYPIAYPLGYVVLRECGRSRKEADELWPWVSDPILAGPRSFTNVRREDDRTTRWLDDNLRTPMTAAGDPNWPAALVLFRLFNRIETGETFFGGGASSPFAAALAANSVEPLRVAVTSQSGAPTGGAYTIPSLNGCGLNKGEGVLAFYAPWFRNNGPIGWRRQTDYWSRPGVTPTLAGLHAWFLLMEGVGPFIAAQFVADAKYVAPFTTAPDWFDWAVQGPGSGPGLNIVFGRPLKAPREDRSWLRDVRWLQGVINPRLTAIGDEPLHAQDVQNVLCETSKAWRFAHSGEPITSSKGFRQASRPPPDRFPSNEAAFETSGALQSI